MADGMEAQKPSFQYRPLGADEIRVIAFDDQERTSPTIHLKLQHTTRPSVDPRSPPYHCLSWTWGQGKPDQLVLIDNSPFYITKNLHDALLHLRTNPSFSSPSFLLWVDLICIQQSDDGEKSIQVVRMSETYTDACKVIVWLGDCSDRREATGEVASFLSRHLPPIPDGHTYVGTKPEYLREAQNAAVLRTLCQDILRRPWWWRMWVIQEVSLARSILVICDGHHLSWEHLVYVTQWLRVLDIDKLKPEAMGPDDTNPYLPNINFKSMYRHKHVFGGDVDLPILELLQNASSCLATNPKDMVYSLLGLATDIESSNHPNNENKLVVDYREETSVEQVYIDFAKLHIRTHKENPLEVITFSRPDLAQQHEGGLPSWVPDWSNLRDTSCYSLASPAVSSASRAAVAPPYLYRASGTRSQHPQFTPNNGLRVKGIRFDTVAQVGQPYRDGPAIGNIMSAVRDWQTLALGEQFERARHRYPCSSSESSSRSDQTLLDAFDRTIMVDTSLDGCRLEPSSEGFLSLQMRIARGIALRRSAAPLPEEGSGNGFDDVEEWLADELGALSRATRALELRLLRRRFFVTSKGFFGLGPRGTKPGDEVFVLYGCNVPVVLRRSGEFWTLVGEAFVAGIMDGEVIHAQAADNPNPGDGEAPQAQSSVEGRSGNWETDETGLLEARCVDKSTSGGSSLLLEAQAANGHKPRSGENRSGFLPDAQAANRLESGNGGEHRPSSLLKGSEETIEIR